MTYLVSSTGPNLCHLLLLFLPPQNIHQLQDAEDSKEKQENASLCLPFYRLPQQGLNFIKDHTIAKLSQWFSITDLTDTRPGLFTYFVTILDVLWHFAGGKVLENLKSCLILFCPVPSEDQPQGTMHRITGQVNSNKPLLGLAVFD